MSRVTIKELHWEIERDIYASKVWDEYKDIEVVPRKIVEMIIEKCIRDESEPAYSNAIREEATDIRKYAESLLKQFEEGDFSNTEKCSVEPLPFEV